MEFGSIADIVLRGKISRDNKEESTMDMNYKVTEEAKDIRWMYEFEGKNRRDESLVVEITKCTNPGGKNSLPYLWKKHGWINRVLESYWGVQVYVTDTEGKCRGDYNPTSKISDDGKRMVINFDWMFEATEENREKLLKEIYSRFINAE